MKLPRPYIPLAVRLEVAREQLLLNDRVATVQYIESADVPDSNKLRAMLYHLFGYERVHLDHDPPLMERKRARRGKYIPDANDPKYLVYRVEEQHRIKTFVRGDGARRSDMSQRRYLKRVAANRDPKRRKKKIPQRKNFKWPKRKLRRT